MLLGSSYLLVVVCPVLSVNLYLTQTLIRINVSASGFWLLFMSAVGPGKYLVAFDNNETMECPSNCLCVESRTSAIPPDVPPIQALQRPAGAPP
jgi:hypothetical protein